jgi:tetratricopeptide (TPR) repeat protein
MSPEQITGKATAQSDIYAIGCILYEMLSGDALFQADSATGLIYKQINEDPTQQLKSLKSAPQSLRLLLEKMLKKKPEDRFQTCADVITALEAVMSNPDKQTRESSRSPKLVASVIALVTIASVGIFSLMKSANNVKSNNADKLHTPRVQRHLLTRTQLSTEEIVQQSQRLRTSFRARDAAAILKNTLLKRPDIAGDVARKSTILRELAYCYLANGQKDLALETMQTAIDTVPEKGSPVRLSAASELAKLWQQLGKIDKAKQVYRQYTKELEGIPYAQASNLYIYTDYSRLLFDDHKLDEAYFWAKKADHLAAHSVHGWTPTVSDRATINAVDSAWNYYDICKVLGKTAEGQKQLDATLHDLKTTAARDTYTALAIAEYGAAAAQRGFFEQAKAMNDLALKESARLSPPEASMIQSRCQLDLATMKKLMLEGKSRQTK